MRGTEKQLAWATEIQNKVIGILTETITATKSDPRYSQSAAAQKNVAMLQQLCEAAENCEYAGDMIDAYKRAEDLRGIISAYKIHKGMSPLFPKEI